MTLEKEQARETAIKRKNRNIVAKFLALHLDNEDRQKCLVTFNGNKGTYKEAIEIRRDFILKITSIFKRDEYNGQGYNYFANVEFGKEASKKFNIHVHFQIFHDNINPIQEAYEYIIDKYNLDDSRHHLLPPDTPNTQYTYVIKDYLSQNFNPKLEEMKDRFYKGKSMHSSSRKKTPNYLIRCLYDKLAELDGWDDTKDKYSFILKLLSEGILSIKKVSGKLIKGYTRVKKWIYKITPSIKQTQTYPHKTFIHRTRESKLFYPLIFALVFILTVTWQLFTSEYIGNSDSPNVYNTSKPRQPVPQNTT